MNDEGVTSFHQFLQHCPGAFKLIAWLAGEEPYEDIRVHDDGGHLRCSGPPIPPFRIPRPRIGDLTSQLFIREDGQTGAPEDSGHAIKPCGCIVPFRPARRQVPLLLAVAHRLRDHG